VLKAPKGHWAVNTRWCFEPPLLLALPFGAFAVVTITTTSSLSAMRFVGPALLAVLCLLSIAYGVRRSPRHSKLEEPDAKCAVETPAKGTATGVVRHENTENWRSKELDRKQLAIPVLLRTATHDAQLEIATVLGAIAIVAFGFVAFLVAGQIQRSGRITSFGLMLGCSLILVPAFLALHLLLCRTDVEFNPRYISIVRKRGLLGSTVTRWCITELQVVRLETQAIGATLNLVVRSQNQQRTILLRGMAVRDVHKWLELGSE
jgi:hypothetical protein